MRLLISNLSSFVITHRNEDNSKFFIRPKSDFERELILKKEDVNSIILSIHQGSKKESDIINMMNDGDTFYTYNISDDNYTKVNVIHNDNIKTNPNRTKLDNIENLPIY